MDPSDLPQEFREALAEMSRDYSTESSGRQHGTQATGHESVPRPLAVPQPPLERRPTLGIFDLLAGVGRAARERIPLLGMLMTPVARARQLSPVLSDNPVGLGQFVTALLGLPSISRLPIGVSPNVAARIGMNYGNTRRTPETRAGLRLLLSEQPHRGSTLDVRLLVDRVVADAAQQVRLLLEARSFRPERSLGLGPNFRGIVIGSDTYYLTPEKMDLLAALITFQGFENLRRLCQNRAMQDRAALGANRHDEGVVDALVAVSTFFLPEKEVVRAEPTETQMRHIMRLVAVAPDDFFLRPEDLVVSPTLTKEALERHSMAELTTGKSPFSAQFDKYRSEFPLAIAHLERRDSVHGIVSLYFQGSESDTCAALQELEKMQRETIANAAIVYGEERPGETASTVSSSIPEELVEDHDLSDERIFSRAVTELEDREYFEAIKAKCRVHLRSKMEALLKRTSSLKGTFDINGEVSRNISGDQKFPLAYSFIFDMLVNEEDDEKMHAMHEGILLEAPNEVVLNHVSLAIFAATKANEEGDILGNIYGNSRAFSYLAAKRLNDLKTSTILPGYIEEYTQSFPLSCREFFKSIIAAKTTGEAERIVSDWECRDKKSLQAEENLLMVALRDELKARVEELEAELEETGSVDTEDTRTEEEIAIECYRTAREALQDHPTYRNLAIVTNEEEALATCKRCPRAAALMFTSIKWNLTDEDFSLEEGYCFDTTTGLFDLRELLEQERILLISELQAANQTIAQYKADLEETELLFDECEVDYVEQCMAIRSLSTDGLKILGFNGDALLSEQMRTQIEANPRAAYEILTNLNFAFSVYGMIRSLNAQGEYESRFDEDLLLENSSSLEKAYDLYFDRGTGLFKQDAIERVLAELADSEGHHPDMYDEFGTKESVSVEVGDETFVIPKEVDMLIEAVLVDTGLALDTDEQDLFHNEIELYRMAENFPAGTHIFLESLLDRSEGGRREYFEQVFTINKDEKTVTVNTAKVESLQQEFDQRVDLSSLSSRGASSLADSPTAGLRLPGEEEEKDVAPTMPVGGYDLWTSFDLFEGVDDLRAAWERDTTALHEGPRAITGRRSVPVGSGTLLKPSPRRMGTPDDVHPSVPKALVEQVLHPSAPKTPVEQVLHPRLSPPVSEVLHPTLTPTDDGTPGADAKRKSGSRTTATRLSGSLPVGEKGSTKRGAKRPVDGGVHAKKVTKKPVKKKAAKKKVVNGHDKTTWNTFVDRFFQIQQKDTLVIKIAKVVACALAIAAFPLTIAARICCYFYDRCMTKDLTSKDKTDKEVKGEAAKTGRQAVRV